MCTSRKSTWFSEVLDDANSGDQQQDAQPTDAYFAARRIILMAAGLHTNDATKVASFLHLPLVFVSATMLNLDRDAAWAQYGYSEFGTMIRAEPVDEAEVQAVMDCYMETLWGARQAASIDLDALWCSMTWLTEN